MIKYWCALFLVNKKVPPRHYQGDTVMLYTQIHKDERILIEFLFNVQNKSISEIAKLTNRNKSTISREIKRNSNESYEALSAQLKRNNRQWHKHSMYLLK